MSRSGFRADLTRNRPHETDASSNITTSYSDGPAGYAGPLTSGFTVTYLYYSSHGDTAAEADSTGTSSASHDYDPFGAPARHLAGQRHIGSLHRHMGQAV